MNTNTQALREALDLIDEIVLAGMSGSGQESEEGMRDFHARQAWNFIGIAARAKEKLQVAISHPPAPEQPVAPEVARPWHLQDAVPSIVAAQPQAQGEPEVVAYRTRLHRMSGNEYWGYNERNPFPGLPNSGEPLITLQSHREAIAPLQQAARDLARIKAAIKIKGGDEHYPTEWAYLQACKLIDSQKEALAKRDAALQAGVEALTGLLEGAEAMGWNTSTSQSRAAITQAKDAS